MHRGFVLSETDSPVPGMMQEEASRVGLSVKLKQSRSAVKEFSD